MSHLSPGRQSQKILPVILAGGAGSRMWPLSRENHPKPFIRLSDQQSLIQKTYLRATAMSGVNEVMTIINRDLFFYAKDEYEACDTFAVSNTFLLEPFGRSSTAAIALAALEATAKHGEDCLLLILPADHAIEQFDAFQQAVEQGARLADEGYLVTFGIQPDSPKTSYGYIQAKGHQVLQFVEKPDADTAKSYLDAGDFFWNAGIFCVKTKEILSELLTYCPDILMQAEQCINHAKRSKGAEWDQLEINASDFEKVTDISIDYAVFERSKRIAMVPCTEIGWSDIGSWLEFGQLTPPDAANNHVIGDVVLEGVEDSIIHAEARLVAVMGIKGLVIVETNDAILVADKGRVQEVRTIVKQLKDRSHESYRVFSTVRRPWGSYTVLEKGDGFQIKRIEVKPGAALSLQSHQHRSEHWVVVDGQAKVLNGVQELILDANQSVYIPKGNKHRLENIGEQLLILIEVQCGGYLGEDDIVRYDDRYGRTAS